MTKHQNKARMRSRGHSCAEHALPAQVAARAQRASVEASEVLRYEEYDRRHGARYVAPGGDASAMDEDDW